MYARCLPALCRSVTTQRAGVARATILSHEGIWAKHPVSASQPTRTTHAVSSGRVAHLPLDQKAELVQRLLAAKESSGKTYDTIAKETGLTNAYVAQLFLNQAQLKASTVEKLQKSVPTLTDDDIEIMQRCPFRDYDSAIREEPLIYRLEEAVMHYGEALKQIVNEQCGDGIMSAIDFYCTVEKIKGAQGEDRVLIKFNGKFLPHVEQLQKNNTAK